VPPRHVLSPPVHYVQGTACRPGDHLMVCRKGNTSSQLQVYDRVPSNEIAATPWPRGGLGTVALHRPVCHVPCHVYGAGCAVVAIHCSARKATTAPECAPQSAPYNSPQRHPKSRAFPMGSLMFPMPWPAAGQLADGSGMLPGGSTLLSQGRQYSDPASSDTMPVLQAQHASQEC
jgi:hypothetical protein